MLRVYSLTAREQPRWLDRNELYRDLFRQAQAACLKRADEHIRSTVLREDNGKLQLQQDRLEKKQNWEHYLNIVRALYRYDVVLRSTP